MSKIFKRVAVGVVALLAGCSTTQINEQTGRPVDAKAIHKPELIFKTNDPSKAIVSVFRDSGITGSACNFDLYVNNSKTATLAPARYVSLELVPGPYFMNIKGSGRGLCPNWDISQNMELKAGESQSYRVMISGGTGTLVFTRTK